MKIQIISERGSNCLGCEIIKKYLNNKKKSFDDLYVQDMPKYIFTKEFRENKGWPHIWIDGVFAFHGCPDIKHLDEIFNSNGRNIRIKNEK